jgi:hypothetical protein
VPVLVVSQKNTDMHTYLEEEDWISAMYIGKYLFEQSSCSTEWSTESRADRQTDGQNRQSSKLAFVELMCGAWDKVSQ